MRGLVIVGVLALLAGPAAGQGEIECTFLRDEVTAQGRICLYSCLGERRQSTIERHQRCPRQVNVPRSQSDSETNRTPKGESGSGAVQRDDGLPESGRLN